MIGARVTGMTNQKCELANVWIYDMLMWIQSLKMIGCDVMCQRVNAARRVRICEP